MFKKGFRRTQPDFHSRTRHARKILVVDIGGLGDVVHALPSLWAIRQSYPQAALHCVVRGHLVALLRIAPWIDHVWPYHGKKKQVANHDVKMAGVIRAQRYDLSINLMGSNRSCIISRVTGARHRLGRRPAEDDRNGWRWLNTEVMDYPYRQEQRYLQKWKCLAQAGIIDTTPCFPIVADLAPLPPGIEPADKGRYLHLSPGTSDALRELPTAQLAELLVLLKQVFPTLGIVLSGADNPRERAGFDALLGQLPFQPWRVYNGSLDAAELFAVVRDAALHLSGDTGTMHLAWLAGTPSVSWFRSCSSPEWQPQGERHVSLFADCHAPDHLRGLDNASVIAAACRLLPGLANA
jgi:heptosyltransferase-1/heptosyltransferase-2